MTQQASAAVNCCETREEEENPNPAAVDSIRKRRPTWIDQGKEVDVRAQEKETSIDELQQTGITLYFLIPSILHDEDADFFVNLVCMES